MKGTTKSALFMTACLLLSASSRAQDLTEAQSQALPPQSTMESVTESQEIPSLQEVEDLLTEQDELIQDMKASLEEYERLQANSKRQTILAIMASLCVGFAIGTGARQLIHK